MAPVPLIGWSHQRESVIGDELVLGEIGLSDPIGTGSSLPFGHLTLYKYMFGWIEEFADRLIGIQEWGRT